MDTDNNLGAKNGAGVFLKAGKELSAHWDIQGVIPPLLIAVKSRN